MQFQDLTYSDLEVDQLGKCKPTDGYHITICLHLIIEQSFDPENIHLSSGDMHKHVSDNLCPESTFMASSSGQIHYR